MFGDSAVTKQTKRHTRSQETYLPLAVGAPSWHIRLQLSIPHLQNAYHMQALGLPSSPGGICLTSLHMGVTIPMGKRQTFTLRDLSNMPKLVRNETVTKMSDP